MLTLEMIRDHLFLESVLDNIDEGINIVDKDGLVVYANRLSADYAGVRVEDMLGKKIEDFYPDAVLLNVIRTKRPHLDRKIHYVDDKIYIVSSYPVIIDTKFLGAFSIFRDIKEVDQLSRTIRTLRLNQILDDPIQDVDSIIGHDGSLSQVIESCKDAIGSIGGPRHILISGQEGTGRAMIARTIYNYAKKISAIQKDAPYISFSPNHYSNELMAARDLFGYVDETGRTRQGLIDQAAGGIIYIEDVEDLGPYQKMVIGLIDHGLYKVLGSTEDYYSPVTIIFSTRQDRDTDLNEDLKTRLFAHTVQVPDYYARPQAEKCALFDFFKDSYIEGLSAYQDKKFKVNFDDRARSIIINTSYPRNISQLRETIYYAIDQAGPRLDQLEEMAGDTIEIQVDPSHLGPSPKGSISKEDIYPLIDDLAEEGLGPRKISNRLKDLGIDFKYYQVAYYLDHK